MKKIFNRTFLNRLWITYALFSVLLVIYLVYSLICKDIDKTSNRIFIDEHWDVNINGELHKDKNLTSFKVGTLKKGDTISISRKLPDEWNYEQPALYIYIKHTTMDIYIDDISIYSYGDDRYKANKATGSGAQIINFSNDYKNKTIRIDLLVTENNPFSKFGSFYITEWKDSYRYIMTTSFIPLLVGSFLVVFGAFVILISSYAITLSKKYTNILLLAAFSTCIGLWTLCYNDVLIIFSIPLYSSSLIEYMSLYIAPVPFLGFMYDYVKKLSNNILTIIFKILFSTQFLFTVIGIALHTADIVHASSLLNYLHLLMAMHLVFFIYIFFKNIKLNQLKKRSYSIGLLLFAITTLYDIAEYHFLRKIGYDILNIKGISSIGITIFLAVLALDVFSDITKKLMEDNEKEILIRNAYTDQLTGLYNRHYCTEYMSNLDNEENTNYSLIIFDLNNLKVTNDTLGHSVGDLFIKESSLIIKDSFKEHGIIGRLGGDEFIAIINTCDTTLIKELIVQFEDNIKNFNQNADKFSISIAYGYATCKDIPDASTEKLYTLADSRMYTCKKNQKNNQ